MAGYRSLKKAAGWFAVFLCICMIGGAPATFGYQSEDAIKNRHAEMSGEESISKILAVLEARNPNRIVLDRAAEKLLSSHEKNLRLMSSLCDRILLNSNSAGAEIAFSLITAMLVLS